MTHNSLAGRTLPARAFYGVRVRIRKDNAQADVLNFGESLICGASPARPATERTAR